MENGLNHLGIMINKKRTKLRLSHLVHSLPERLRLRSGSYLYVALILSTLQRNKYLFEYRVKKVEILHLYVV